METTALAVNLLETTLQILLVLLGLAIDVGYDNRDRWGLD
jgi:hypothetical protein